MPTVRFARWLVPMVLLAGAGLAFGDSPADASHKLARTVDRLLTEEVLSKSPEQPAGRCSDETFLRRAFLDLVGVPPAPDDVLAFALDARPDKRNRLVDTLLADKDFGRNWARYWRDVILYRRTEDRALVAAESVTSYLAEEFHRGTPWDQIARSFVTARGDVREVGATAIIMAQAGQPEETVSELSRIFCGIQIQCAQCHDHPTDAWKREQFHQLAAFFPRVAVQPRPEEKTFRVVVDDLPALFRRNDNNRFRGTPEHRMPDLKRPGEPGSVMQPVFFVGGQSVPLGTRDAERRAKLAEWLTSAENPWFARSFVNRVWAELLGEGFYAEIDDLGPERECVAPKTLDCLAEAFVAGGYDVKALYRTLLATDAYQRVSRARRSPNDPPFLANVAQRLRSDQLFDSLVVALGLDETRMSNNRGPMNRPFARGPRFAFNAAFGFDPSDPREDVQGSIPQALLLMNSPAINFAVSGLNPNGLGGLLRSVPKDEDLVTDLYVRVLSRAPTADEKKRALDYVRQVALRAEAFEDLLWAMVNSAEFLHRP